MASLLEREGRIDEAVEAWRFIRDWSEASGVTYDPEWPRQGHGGMMDPLSCQLA